jgi:hypothetical protein
VRRLVVAAALWALAALPARAADDAAKLAATFADAVRAANEAHAKSPREATERDVAKRTLGEAGAIPAKLVRAKDAPGLADALATAATAALDLDLVDDFENLRGRLDKLDAARAKAVGVAVSRERFLVIATGGLTKEYAARVADVVDAILAEYDEAFGFTEWSKVPGKKLRFRFHLEAKATRPPHFAPEFPFHSEIDFPVDDAKAFASPTPDGRFLLYGLCHELGHVIAMWGDVRNEEDRHAWAHYTGCLIVERLAARKPVPRAVEGMRDVKWRSLEIERKRLADAKPSLADRDGVLATLLALHDLVGPRAIGWAVNDMEPRCLRVNRVRYHSFQRLRETLVRGEKDEAKRKRIAELLP